MKEQKVEDREKLLYERINKFYLAQYKMTAKILKYMSSTDIEKVRDVLALSKKILLNGKNSLKMLNDLDIELEQREDVSLDEKNEIKLIKQSFKEQYLEYKNYCTQFERHYDSLEASLQNASNF